MRKNLSIQVLKLESKSKRYAWILENIPKLEGSGIIYCLTRDDCDDIAKFLMENDITARAYYSGKKGNGDDISDLNEETERLFMNNEIKVIVATVKLGMGYDKGDISFVIHYQTPPSIVAYYQQIGRAGRNIDRAYTFLMHGKEDEDILEYFRRTAFPTEQETKSVYNYIKNNSKAKLYDIMSNLNISKARIENALKFLTNEEFIYKSNSTFYPSANVFQYNKEHYAEITMQRENEFSQMLQLIDTDECYSRFIVNALDDDTQETCELCANCLKYEEFSSDVSENSVNKTAEYLEKQYYEIMPRLQWAKTSFTAMTKIEKPNETGICLSRYGHPIYGELVKKGKYEETAFDDKLVEKSEQVLYPFITEHEITAITCVPSFRSDIVKNFAERLAEKLKLPFIDMLIKTSARQQKEMENSNFQCENALSSFSLINGAVSPKKILLIDDMVDSKWTITVCGDLLTKAGAEHVYPYVLASTSKKDD